MIGNIVNMGEIMVDNENKYNMEWGYLTGADFDSNKNHYFTFDKDIHYFSVSLAYNKYIYRNEGFTTFWSDFLPYKTCNTGYIYSIDITSVSNNGRNITINYYNVSYANSGKIWWMILF